MKINDSHNYNIKELRKKAGYTANDMMNVFGYNNVQSWRNKEDGIRKLKPAELNYFLLVTDNHPTEKIVYTNSNNSIFKTLVFLMETKQSEIANIFIKGGNNDVAIMGKIREIYYNKSAPELTDQELEQFKKGLKLSDLS